MLISCAKVVAPTGGEKDRVGPKIISSSPENEAVNFKGKSLELEFDEYIKAGQLSSQLLITPPLNEKPRIKVGSRSIKISWENDLKENTTYLFQFGEGIVDLTEGNPSESGFFVFSTGAYLDSAQLSLQLKDLETNKETETATILLYDSASYDFSMLTDSSPAYIAKAKDGLATLNYIKQGKYYIFALKDENKDYRYQAGEEIAYPEKPVFLSDSSHLDLQLFKAKAQHKKTQLSLIDSCTFSLHFPNSNSKEASIAFAPNIAVKPFWNEKKDSLFIQTDLSEVDSLLVLVQFNDTLDSLKIKPRKLSSKPWRVYASQAKYHALDSVHVYFNNWINSYSRDSLVLKAGQEQLKLAYAIKKNKISFAAPDSAKSYQVDFFPGQLKADCSFNQDTLSYNFRVSDASDWGSLSFTDADSIGHPVVYQLLKDGKLVFETSQAQFEISHLSPGAYKLRKILDYNANGKWDPGIVELLSPAEPIIYYSAGIEVRANWEQEITGFR